MPERQKVQNKFAEEIAKMFTNPFNRSQKVKGTVILMHRNVLDINALTAGLNITGGFKVLGNLTSSIIDTYASILGSSVALRLISATSADGNYFLISHTTVNKHDAHHMDVYS